MEPVFITTNYAQRIMGRVYGFYMPIYKILEYPWRHFTSLKLCNYSQILYPSLRVAITPNRLKTNHYWLNLLNLLASTNAPHALSYTTFLAVDVSASSSTPAVTNGNHIPYPIRLINTRNKKIKLRFTQPPHFIQLHQGQKEILIY